MIRPSPVSRIPGSFLHPSPPPQKPQAYGPQAARPPGGQTGFARFGGSAAGPAARLPPDPATRPSQNPPSPPQKISPATFPKISPKNCANRRVTAAGRPPSGRANGLRPFRRLRRRACGPPHRPAPAPALPKIRPAAYTPKLSRQQIPSSSHFLCKSDPRL